MAKPQEPAKDILEGYHNLDGTFKAKCSKHCTKPTSKSHNWLKYVW